MPQTAPLDDNRSLVDRRRFGWRTVLYGFLRSRRRAQRRSDEAEPIFSDWHHPWLFFLAVGTMLFSSLDALMTLELLRHGAHEANPVMASVMSQSTQVFATSKMVMTGVGIMALVFLSRARFMNQFRTGVLLTAVFSLYACLVCYEFVHLLRVH